MHIICVWCTTIFVFVVIDYPIGVEISVIYKLFDHRFECHSFFMFYLFIHPIQQSLGSS